MFQFGADISDLKVGTTHQLARKSVGGNARLYVLLRLRTGIRRSVLCKVQL
jgi:hypothetical protein